MTTVYTPHTIMLTFGEYVFRAYDPARFNALAATMEFDVATAGANVRARRFMDPASVALPPDAASVRRSVGVNFHAFADGRDGYVSFEKALAAGFSYLGYSKRSPVPANLAPYIQLAFAHAEVEFSVTTAEWPGHGEHITYTIYRRGEYVAVDKYDRGRETGWITRDGRVRHLVNVD